MENSKGRISMNNILKTLALGYFALGGIYSYKAIDQINTWNNAKPKHYYVPEYRSVQRLEKINEDVILLKSSFLSGALAGMLSIYPTKRKQEEAESSLEQKI